VSLFKKLFGRNDAPSSEAEAVGDMNEALRLYRKGAFSEALRIADRLIAAGPGIALSWRFRGECLFSLKRYADAVAAFDKAGAIGGRGADDVFLWAALALHNAGRQDEARARLRQALSGSGLSPELRARTEDALKSLEGP